ncbi:hypothetical protein [Comamonas sp. JC664]|uniref:hypothetical protein n=1 Tax=Comamonas sp. JC664 TaxID=2801917 RepID=UPI00174B76DC|nr:hypothetical protein [Comamonas sp. JC664]MBL0696367.1 hypothetical protein [Comamonas sp. JC664]GHG83923.1 hypothetical protein GCM10012319_38890 [Comamonas sp. KCTC 72670]
MKAELRLWIESNAPGGKVPAIIRSLDGEEEQKVLIPIGMPATAVQLAPGSYFVEAYLPSGELLRRFVDLSAARPEGVAVGLSPSRSPHEWLEFQHLILPPERLRESLTGPKVYYLDDYREPDIQLLSPFGGPLGQPGEKLLNALIPERITYRAPSPDLFRLVANDDTLFRYEFTQHRTPQGVPAALLITPQWEHVFVPVPFQWLTIDHKPVPIELVVNRVTESVSVTVADPDFAPVLGYLASGHSELAARALKDVSLGLLFSKLENPFAAAAGGYVLVQSWTSGQEDEHSWSWRRWIHNLADRFPFLPDGAILEGRVLLSLDSSVAREQAALRFLEAFSRGVPYFSAGLRMLLEGLLAIDNAPLPAEIRQRFKVARHHVRKWATWMDPREPFTTLHIPEREWS